MSAIGQILTTGNGGTSVSGFGNVTAYTANQALSATQSYQVFSNAGAPAAVTLTLPPPTVGLEYTFVIASAQTLIVSASTGVTIAVGEIASSAGGQVSASTIYSMITLKAISSTLWVTISITGTWTPA